MGMGMGMGMGIGMGRGRGRNLSGAGAGAGNFKNGRLRQPCCKGSAKLPNCKHVPVLYHEWSRSRGSRIERKASLPPEPRRCIVSHKYRNHRAATLPVLFISYPPLFYIVVDLHIRLFPFSLPTVQRLSCNLAPLVGCLICIFLPYVYV